MKLTHKLTLAFLLISLIIVGLTAALVWATTSIQFSNYLLDQRRSEFIALAGSYYQSNGSWEGIDRALRQQGLLPVGAPPAGQPPPPQPFALVSDRHIVIIPGGTYVPGQQVPDGTLAQGTPIYIDGRVVGTVLTTGQPPNRTATEELYTAGINRSLLFIALGGGVLALLLGLFMARALTRPVRDLMLATKALAQGELGHQVPVRSKDELGELAASFNQMGADLASANQARRQMTADIAHDLRNPLTVVGGYLESLKDGKLAATPERIGIMQSEIQHLQHLVEDLRILSLADAGELTIRRRRVAPDELLKRAALAYQSQAAGKKINLNVEIEPGLAEIDVDPERLEQVLGNLLSNALRYTAQAGRISLTAKQAGGDLILSVKDNGSGVSPEDLPHIFERSYRGDASRAGNESGLGLAIAKSIVELHGGSLRVESGEHGSTFSIHLPR